MHTIINYFVRNLPVADLGIPRLSFPFAIVTLARPVSLATEGFSLSVRLSLVGFIFWRVGLVDHSHRC